MVENRIRFSWVCGKPNGIFSVKTQTIALFWCRCGKMEVLSFLLFLTWVQCLWFLFFVLKCLVNICLIFHSEFFIFFFPLFSCHRRSHRRRAQSKFLNRYLQMEFCAKRLILFLRTNTQIIETRNAIIFRCQTFSIFLFAKLKSELKTIRFKFIFIRNVFFFSFKQRY